MVQLVLIWGLNPCSNGICVKEEEEVEPEDPETVLILVLMEYV